MKLSVIERLVLFIGLVIILIATAEKWRIYEQTRAIMVQSGDLDDPSNYNYGGLSQLLVQTFEKTSTPEEACIIAQKMPYCRLLERHLFNPKGPGSSENTECVFSIDLGLPLIGQLSDDGLNVFVTFSSGKGNVLVLMQKGSILD